MPTDKIIPALDLDSGEQALALVRQLKSQLSLFKVGKQLFTREGPALIKALRQEGVEVFLDLKFHDIPQTVAKATAAAASLDVRFLTLHTSGGSEMMRAALQAVQGSPLQLLGVTVLTSMDDDGLREVGVDHTAQGQVLNLARLAEKSGLSGLVCSPLEADLIRRQVSTSLTLVTPGIRSAADAAGDQKRTLSGPEAFQAGANYLVVGRPIVQASDPAAAARALIAECGL
jgi:orotidine-5'-phosphate decarboxylase